MLKVNGSDFTLGRSLFCDDLPGNGEGAAKIYVKVAVGHLGPMLAQLDTGAAWSVFDPEVAEAIGVPEPLTDPIRIDTRFGWRDGHLARVPITLVADDGESLEVDATIFVCTTWPPGKNFVGYNGLLERIRIALDPQQHYFYFGP